MRFGLGTIFLLTTIIAFALAICRVPDDSPYGPKNIHPLGAFVFATIVVVMLSFAMVEIARALGLGKRSELRLFRDRKYDREVDCLDRIAFDFHGDSADDDTQASSTIVGDDEGNRTRETRRNRWWAKDTPNRLRDFGLGRES